MEYVLIFLFMLFTLWLGSKIVEKAGYPKLFVLCLLIPILNVAMIWFFAFSKWPNLKADIDQIT
ncbi:conserved hypothetical protein [Bathymodiolus platifrons methanotrophic gill symbiont]|nr:hypothetical protein BMR11_15300 [Methylococcaceae bacterium CS5]TXL03491.1 hypothetical protein BMR09_14795 [Methylococcaceae bacterium CS3]TXL07752.1 hypothetical protein BMR07_04095 [Methylococcaceae bacterium CS1]TXL10701.1 hypothetical protein BMR05_16390 [Methylococcaceae bacterium HT4]TXL11273.1 hypothetical protein BMR04_16085 [Methylococcaceae bacterium HT3]TXL12213.1 hypothetical protein BMR08_00025 [Methylococcaceae bacterium CS2]TXL16926.1 hypothetical protein BMR03_16205 [Meth